MKKLSVIIAHRNEPEHLLDTVRSIRETSPRAGVEIVVVDDASQEQPEEAVALDGIFQKECGIDQFITEPERRGHAHCRTVGAECADGQWLLLTDAHMKFAPGWWERFQSTSRAHTGEVLICGPYFACNETGALMRVFFGSRFYFWEEQGEKIDCVGIQPLLEKPVCPDLWEVPAVIGANYFIPRDWFRYLGGLPGMFGWSGCDEWLLAVKTWLAGGRVLLDPRLELHHWLYPTPEGKSPKEMRKSELIFNKLSAAYQVLSESDWAAFLQNWPVPHSDPTMAEALAMFEARRETIPQRAAHQAEHDIEWLCARFGLNHPADLGAVFAA